MKIQKLKVQKTAFSRVGVLDPEGVEAMVMHVEALRQGQMRILVRLEEDDYNIAVTVLKEDFEKAVRDTTVLCVEQGDTTLLGHFGAQLQSLAAQYEEAVRVASNRWLRRENNSEYPKWVLASNLGGAFYELYVSPDDVVAVVRRREKGGGWELVPPEEDVFERGSDIFNVFEWVANIKRPNR